MPVTIRPLTAGHVDFAVAQTAREGWATGASLFETYLEHDRDGGFIACSGNRAVGMVTTTRYPATGWIGNLIVEPAYRSRGIGRILMERGLRRLHEAGVTSVRLDGDPPGIPLYRNLGFVDEYESLRYRWHGVPGTYTDAADPLDPGWLAAVVAFDGRHFGDDRGRLLGIMLKRSHRSYVIRRNAAVCGYVLVEETNLGLRAGPCVAESEPVARRLLCAVLASAGGRPVTLGIPAPNKPGRVLLESLGFSPTPSSLRMIRGTPRGRGDLHHIFAIAGGAVG